ncbi:YihY/virulence factor BrkB family protein [Chloroflexota bacterium]
MNLFKAIYALLKETIEGWSQANGNLLAAALAYYAVFSLAPLLVIALAVAGLVFEEAAITIALLEQVGGMVSPEVELALRGIIQNINRYPRSGLAATISIAVLGVSASILFVQLKRAINFLWGIVPQPGKGLIIVIKTHFLSLLMVMLIGLLLIAAMVLGTLLVYMDQIITIIPAFQDGLPQVNFGLMFLTFSLFFALIFKTLPDAEIDWEDVWLGAAVTSIFFTIGEFLIGFYLSRTNLGSAYGAASSFFVVIVWVYFSMQIILFGAKFTQVYADRHGSKVRPDKRTDLVVRKRLQDDN